MDPTQNDQMGYIIYTSDYGNDFYIRKATTSNGATGGVYINDGAESWSGASDESLKTHLEPISDAIAKIKQVRTVTGEWVDRPGRRHSFFIAQDFQAVLPECVSVMNKDAPEEEQLLGMSYTDTIPLVTAALKEAIARIESQQSQIDALTARIEALENA